MNHRRIICLCLTITMIFTLFAASGSALAAEADTSAAVVISGSDLLPEEAPSALIDIYRMSGATAFDIAADMKIGMNLGSSLDSWSLDSGYDDYHNASAYQLMVIYYNKDNEFDNSRPHTFEADNTCTINWDTDMIMSCGAQTKLGKIGFIITNFTVDQPTPIKINVKTAYLAKDTTKIAHHLDELLGEHELIISRYGTTALYTETFPSHLTKTLGVQGSHYKVEIELVDYPERNYTKEQYYETLDKNPQITPQLIRMLKESGFNAVRLPVTYFNHVNSDNVVDKAWLERISEIVEYILSQGMYCIVDMHNDCDVDGWLHSPTFSYDDEGNLIEFEEDEIKAEEAMLKKYSSIWRQVAEHLKPYGDHLLFEGFDELITDTTQWGYPGKEAIEWTNELNQLFVDTVRSTGGNNSERCLLVAPYAGSNEEDMLKGFVLPKDKADERLIVSVHAYTPATLSWHYEDENEVTAWGSQKDRNAIDELFERLDEYIIRKGTPVLVSEFGTVEKAETGVYEDYVSDPEETVEETPAQGGSSGSDSSSQIDAGANDTSEMTGLYTESNESSNIEDRIAHAVYYTGAAARYGIPCFWYDDGTFINRDNNTFFFEDIVTGMVNSASTHVNTLHIADIPDQYYNGKEQVPSLEIYDTSVDISEITATDVSSSDIIGKRLIFGTDYNAIYSQNTELGTATVTIYGLGSYTGVTSVTFDIVERPELVKLLTSGYLTGSPLNDLLTLAFSLPILLSLCVAAIFVHKRKKQYDERRRTVLLATEQARHEVYVNADDDEEFDNFEPEPDTPTHQQQSFFRFSLPTDIQDDLDDDF